MSCRALMLSLVSVVVALLLTAVRAQEPGLCTDSTGDASHCICSTPDGVIDVTSLGNTDGTPRYKNLKGVNNGDYMYDFNPCHGFSLQGTTCTDTVACQESSGGDNFECGAISAGKFFYENDKAYLQYSDGEDGRLTQVNLICDKTIETVAQVVAYGDSFDRFKIYDFDIKHKCACPGECVGVGGGGGGVEAGIVGIVFMLLAIAGVITYLIVGVVINVTRFEKKGIDAIPNKEFWMDFPFLLKDGVMFVFGPVIAAIRRRTGGGGGQKGAYDQF